MGMIKTFFGRMVRFSLIMGLINLIIGFLKPYLQVIIYHIIVGPRILFSSFLAIETLNLLVTIFGLVMLWVYIKLINKYF